MSPVPLNQHLYIVISFLPAELKVSNLVGQVLRRIEHVQKGKRFYEYETVFTTVLAADRTSIRKYVFDHIQLYSSAPASPR